MVKDEIHNLAEKLGIKPENLDFGLEKEKEKTKAAVMKAAKFMGLK